MRMEKIPSNGNHMTMIAFVRLCERGSLTDNDGYGSLATEMEMSTEDIQPSYFSFTDRTAEQIAESYRIQGWTHVVWVNCLGQSVNHRER